MTNKEKLINWKRAKNDYYANKEASRIERPHLKSITHDPMVEAIISYDLYAVHNTPMYKYTEEEFEKLLDDSIKELEEEIKTEEIMKNFKNNLWNWFMIESVNNEGETFRWVNKEVDNKDNKTSEQTKYKVLEFLQFQEDNEWTEITRMPEHEYKMYKNKIKDEFCVECGVHNSEREVERAIAQYTYDPDFKYDGFPFEGPADVYEAYENGWITKEFAAEKYMVNVNDYDCGYLCEDCKEW